MTSGSRDEIVCQYSFCKEWKKRLQFVNDLPASCNDGEDDKQMKEKKVK